MFRKIIDELDIMGSLDDVCQDGSYVKPSDGNWNIDVRRLLNWCKSLNIDPKDLTEDQIQKFKIKKIMLDKYKNP